MAPFFHEDIGKRSEIVREYPEDSIVPGKNVKLPERIAFCVDVDIPREISTISIRSFQYVSNHMMLGAVVHEVYDLSRESALSDYPRRELILATEHLDLTEPGAFRL